MQAGNHLIRYAKQTGATYSGFGNTSRENHSAFRNDLRIMEEPQGRSVNNQNRRIGKACQSASHETGCSADDYSGRSSGFLTEPHSPDLFISRGASITNFVLVKINDSVSFSVVRYFELDEKVLQMDIRYINNSVELSLLSNKKKYSSDGIYVNLEEATKFTFETHFQKVRKHLDNTLFGK